MANLIKTSTKAISCISDEGTKEFEECKKAFEENVGKIVLGSAEKLLVLSIIFREMRKLGGKHKWIRFNFGGKKEFELRRLK